MMDRPQWDLSAHLCLAGQNGACPAAPGGSFNLDCQFYSFFFFPWKCKVSSSCRSRECFGKGILEPFGGNLCTGGEQEVQITRELSQGRSCSSSLGICLCLWLTVAMLSQPASFYCRLPPGISHGIPLVKLKLNG